MKNSILTGFLLMFSIFLGACANNSHGTTDTNCTQQANGLFVNSSGQACQAVTGTGTGYGYTGTGTGYTGTGYGNTGYSVPSCDIYNVQYAGYAYYVPMQVQGTYYCVNVQGYVPQSYYGDVGYGQSYGGYGGSSYYSGGQTCFGLGVSGSSYGISGSLGICF